ncbi:MAG: LPS export ABC transporter periplasmic protein LptC, partial [Planctomycetota bacterium]
MAGAYEKVCAVRLEPEGGRVFLADKLFGFVMGTHSRKFIIGLVSLAVVLTVFLLYNLMSRTPPIDINRGAQPDKKVSDSNAAEFDREVGKIADVGVGTIRKAKYTHLNAQKQLDREFGFERLLHEEADQWEIEKPYMNIFRRSFKCYITADKGTVQIEDALGRTTPKDATLTGNVVIHIVPETATGVKESFVYLDDVVYISERSQFSTAGPVKFVSPDAQMLGTGMEFVYNDELNRLEFLRIVHLEDLRIRTSSKASLLGSQQTEPPAEPVAGDVTQEQAAEQNAKVAERKSGMHYRCLFDKNVVVNTPEQTVLTDRLSINNILLSKASSSKSAKAEESRSDTSGTHTKAADESTEEFVDVTVTCDGGILVTPMDSPAASESSIEAEPRPALTDNQVTESPNDTADRTKFVAQRIDYCAAAGDTVASGPSELTFYVNDLIDRQATQAPVPVQVTAQKQVQFQPAANQ